MNVPPLRVFLADDHPIVLAGIEAMLRAEPGVEIVGTAAAGTDAMVRIAETAPDVAVIDISMPGMSGLEVAEELRRSHPAVRTLVLTMHEDRLYLEQLLKAGVLGYLLKRSANDELMQALRTVAAGRVYIDPAIVDKAIPRPSSGTINALPLTSRERHVLRLVALGFTNKEIAERMTLGIKTIESYKARATEKLGIRTRAEIVRYAAGLGWLAQTPDAPEATSAAGRAG